MTRLTDMRRARGWSRAELARRAGLNSSTVGMIENGRLRPYRGQLLKLAHALGLRDVDPTSLVEESEGPLRLGRDNSQARQGPESGE